MIDPKELDFAHLEAISLDAARTFRQKVEAAGLGYEPEGPEIEDRPFDISGVCPVEVEVEVEE